MEMQRTKNHKKKKTTEKKVIEKIYMTKQQDL